MAVTTVNVGYGFANFTVAADSIIEVFKGPLYAAPAGTTDILSGRPFKKLDFVAAGSVIAMRGPGSFIKTDWSM